MPMGLATGPNLSSYRIDIEATPQRFAIRDNCGGMTLDNAASHAFSFGRSANSEHNDFSIGVYGIGMKRAVFKLGDDVRVRSTYAESDGSRLSFAVPIDVTAWLTDDAPPWDFDIVEDDDLPENGVEVAVERLTSGTISSFNSPAFLQDLKRTIARDYSLHLQRGLSIFLNDARIEGWAIQLLKSTDFTPVRQDYVDQGGSDEVAVEIIGGMAAPPPESNEPDESLDGDKRFGWYVVCNGRIVLAADKSLVTGWGSDDWPQWHYQYLGFVGVILFTAANASALPLTTTKRSVDTSSEIFRRARPVMRDISKSWIAYTYQRKQALEEARQKERLATAVPLAALEKTITATFPALVAKASTRPANVNYAVPLVRMKNLAQSFGNINMPYRDVGVRAFDYAYKDFVGEE